MRRVLLIISILLIELILFINIQNDQADILIPVQGATVADWNTDSFWYYPWGKSITHKGIDIFKPLNTPVISPVSGIILSAGYNEMGGNYIYLLGPNLRVYYFAHLNKQLVEAFTLVKPGQPIGLVGDTGNAANAPFHLHFSIYSIIPIFKYWDTKAIQGWKKIFYLATANYFLIEK